MQDSPSEGNHQFLETNMASCDLVIGVVSLTQTIVGFLRNFFLLCHDFLYFTRCPLKPVDLILKHLTVASFWVMFCNGLPQTMAALRATPFLSDTGCKVVFYVHRVGRGVGTGITCLLSIFQVITINPRNFRWAELKLQASKYMGPSNILCWILTMQLNVNVPMYVGKWNNKNNTNKVDYGYCSAVIENRVGVLVGTFVLFYTLSSIFSLFLACLKDPGWWLVNTSVLITACFLTVSPFVLSKP
ncbi:Vomeronasal type-1 receptor 3 [Sciurus carolinensis]|uniref:Vomeronasal type-1 receptor n=1 Tax=Sciurus carolinensis TaxID=30640 RepID=A0AA41SQV0_SCICA|nr:Vomeronasal type-1 receptor 3 [Sciurus carolinensis]